MNSNRVAGSDQREGPETTTIRGSRVATKPRSMHARAGVSLVEVMVVITVAAVMVGLAVSVIHLLLRAEREAMNAARTRASVARLAHAFREDIHAAQAIELPVVEPGQPAALITRADGQRQVRYELDAHRATRVESGAPDGASRDDFYFPPDSRLWFEREEQPGLLRLAIDIPRGGNAAHPDSAAASGRPMAHLAIEAALARIRRGGASAGAGEAPNE